MILEWCRVVAEWRNGPVLILAPLAVSQQFVREAAKLATKVTIVTEQSHVDGPGVYVTNYAKLHRFDLSQFVGVALDESSILKSLDGSVRRALIDQCSSVPFRLSASATPSPNDHTELGGQSEFLGLLRHSEMLSTFFIHDGGSTADWRIKGHAEDAFWKWVCSWGAIVKYPSDIGCSDDGYILPALHYHEHCIPATEEDARSAGKLFADPAETMIEQRRVRKATIGVRVAKAAEIANGCSGQAIVWCDLNDESKQLHRAIRNSVEVCGSMTDTEKEYAIESFISGRSKVFIGKPSMCGHGLNLQFARTIVYCGVSHSWEQFYQSSRRSWRFGVQGEVDAHIVTSALEGNVLANLKDKQAKADRLVAETRHHVSSFVRGSVTAGKRETDEYRPLARMTVPAWCYNERTRTI